MKHRGTAHKLGDNINTDYIISSRRKRDSTDPNHLKQYLFDDIDPEFYERVKEGDILVGGVNFGCGSVMEIAVQVIKSAGITLVLAQSFSRHYFRNAINNGLLPVVFDTERINDGDQLRWRIEEGKVVLRNSTQKWEESLSCPALGFLMIEHGGIINYLNAGHTFTDLVSEIDKS